MNDATLVLSTTAFSLALIHTAAGPDHYLPFIVVGKAEKWSLRRILGLTALAGLGHVLSSILLGVLGIALGWSLTSMTWFEGIRGNMAVWVLIAFGFGYMLWGIFRAARGHRHSHDHDSQSGISWSARALLLIFVLGPCEPLIPLLMVPAAEHSIWSIVAVTAVFSVTTVSVMVGCVALAFAGFELFEFAFVRRYLHAFSGFAIGISGILIIVLGV